MSSELLNHFFCEVLNVCVIYTQCFYMTAMQAYKFNIKYPKYEFILVSDHDSDWWVASPQDDSHYGCSSEQRAQVLNYSLTLQWRPAYSQSHFRNITEKVCQTWKVIPLGDLWWITLFPFYMQLDTDLFNYRDAVYCYDAVWILALAFNRTLSGTIYFVI